MIRGAAAIKALRDPRLYGADAPGKTPAEKKQVNFVGLRKRFLTFSACLMAAIVLCAVVLGVHLDTEFTGGAMITLKMCIRDRLRTATSWTSTSRALWMASHSRAARLSTTA